MSNPAKDIDPESNPLGPVVGRLRGTLGKMEIALGSIAEAIAWTDGEGKILWCNRAFDVMVGQHHLFNLGAHLVERFPLSKEGRLLEEEKHPVREAMAFATNLDGVFEYLPPGKDHPLYVEISCRVTMADAHDWLVFTARDITPRRLAEEQLKTLNETLESKVEERTEELREQVLKREKLQERLMQAQKLEAIGQLAAGVAHEINTPAQFVSDNLRFLDEIIRDLSPVLRKIRDQLELASKGELSSEQACETLHDLNRLVEEDQVLEEAIPAIEESLGGVERISKIVGSMKSFAHPGESAFQSKNLNDILEDALTLSVNEWKYVAQLEKDFDSDLPLIPCQVVELSQVFLNLLVNAADAVREKFPEETEELEGLIRVSSRLQDDWVEIRVLDNGMGVPENVRGRIFDPFFTTKEVGKGSGQGLAMAYDVIVRGHAGFIDFESTLGEGTTFLIRLPVSRG